MAVTLSFAGVTRAAEKKPLTNADVVKMAQAGLPESTLIAAIQGNPRNFDSSVEALLALKESGVSHKVIETMLQVDIAQTTARPELGTKTTAVEDRKPQAYFIDQAGTRFTLQATPFKIVQTKAKGNSLAALAAESAVGEIAGSVIQEGAVNVLLSTGGQFAGTLGALGEGLAAGIGRKLFRSDEVKFTYVFALGGQGAEGAPIAQTAKFELRYADLHGVDPEEFTPAIVRVTPTPKNWRLVGAVKARKSDMGMGHTTEFKIIEERVAASVTRIARGHAEIRPDAPLPSGEYAVVLRPVDPNKKVEMHDVETQQEEGVIIRMVWDFCVQAAPPPEKSGIMPN